MAENVAKIADARSAQTPRLTSAGSGGGDYGDMEARLKRLEDDGRELRSDLKVIMRDVSEIKGRIANMPSTWQMLGLIFGTMIGLASLAFVIVRFVLPSA